MSKKQASPAKKIDPKSWIDTTSTYVPGKGKGWVPIGNLKPHPLNARSDESLDESLVASVSKHGIRSPIQVDGDGMIISGHRRYAAAKLCGHVRVPVTVIGSNGDSDALATLLTANVSKSGDALRSAVLLDAYIEAQGCSGSDAALNLGISPGYVSKLSTIAGWMKTHGVEPYGFDVALSKAYGAAKKNDPPDPEALRKNRPKRGQKDPSQGAVSVDAADTGRAMRLMAVIDKEAHPGVWAALVYITTGDSAPAIAAGLLES